MDRELCRRILSSLVDDFEGYGTLALVLNVKVDDLRLWVEGRGQPPTDVLVRIANIAPQPPGVPRR